MALLAHFVERGWLRKATGDRAVALTPAGRLALGRWVRVDDLADNTDENVSGSAAA
ncbi:MAG: hypothetical protein U1F67_14125 [Rubrivivax sp.]